MTEYIFIFLFFMPIFYTFFKYKNILYLLFNHFVIKKYIIKNVPINEPNISIPIRCDRYMIVKYFDEDDENIKSIYIPIRANNALSAAECTVTVHYDDRKIEIKQDTEIPILINAYDMGAKKIVVTNNFSGVQKIFTGNEQPITFLDE